MKQLLSMGLAALSWAACAPQDASAWTNFKFSAGVNLQYQSGGNNLLCGLWRNGQPPGPEAYGCYANPGCYPYGPLQQGPGPQGQQQQQQQQQQQKKQGYGGPQGQDPYFGFQPSVPPQYQGQYQGPQYPGPQFQGQPQYQGQPQPTAVRTPATTTSYSAPQAPGSNDNPFYPTAAGYSNFYGQFYQYQPAYYTSTYEVPQYRIGFNFGQ